MKRVKINFENSGGEGMLTKNMSIQKEVQLSKGMKEKTTKKNNEHQKEISKTPASSKKKQTKTSVVIQYDIGFSNHFSIRGEGAGLSWEKGVPLTNIKSNEWIWETDLPFETCHFKVLINDQAYEQGENHQIKEGDTLSYTPLFYS